MFDNYFIFDIDDNHDIKIIGGDENKFNSLSDSHRDHVRKIDSEKKIEISFFDGVYYIYFGSGSGVVDPSDLDPSDLENSDSESSNPLCHGPFAINCATDY